MAMKPSPRRMTRPQLQGGSLETRPSPEVSPNAMRTRPFRKLVGGHDSTIDPLNNEYAMNPGNQVASNTPDLAKRQGTTNPVKGDTGQGNKLSNMAATTQTGAGAVYPGPRGRAHGRTTMFSSGANMKMKRKLRVAFGGGGTAIPTQSGNRNSSGSGKSMSVDAGKNRAPSNFGGRNTNPGSWQGKGTLGKGQTKATVSATSIRPNQGSRRNV